MTQAARKIDEEAARWAVRLAESPLSTEERRELDAWLSHGPRQHGALVRARAAWLDLDRFAVLAAGARTGSPVQSSRRDRQHFFWQQLWCSVCSRARRAVGWRGKRVE
jgi:ferric-dicitrate binding protein FerR (iron transport regulator)